MPHIYIDEAGSFTTFRETRSSISCVAALVVPESVHDKLLADFQTLSRSWRVPNAEGKGRPLSGHHLDETTSSGYYNQRGFLRIAAIYKGPHTLAHINDPNKKPAK